MYQNWAPDAQFRCYTIFAYFRFENILLRIPSPRIPEQVGRVQIWRLWDFYQARYPAAGHKCKSTVECIGYVPKLSTGWSDGGWKLCKLAMYDLRSVYLDWGNSKQGGQSSKYENWTLCTLLHLGCVRMLKLATYGLIYIRMALAEIQRFRIAGSDET